MGFVIYARHEFRLDRVCGRQASTLRVPSLDTPPISEHHASGFIPLPEFRIPLPLPIRVPRAFWFTGCPGKYGSRLSLRVHHAGGVAVVFVHELPRLQTRRPTRG